MLLALGLGKLSLKLLHDSCGLRLVTNVGQQCSESRRASYSWFRCRADGWEESQRQVHGAFSQAPHLPREPHAVTIRVADVSPAVLHRDLLAAPFYDWP